MDGAWAKTALPMIAEPLKRQPQALGPQINPFDVAVRPVHGLTRAMATRPLSGRRNVRARLCSGIFAARITFAGMSPAAC